LIEAWRIRRAFFIFGGADCAPATTHAPRRLAHGLNGEPATDSVGLRSSHWIPVCTAARFGHAPKRPRQSNLGGMPAATVRGKHLKQFLEKLA